jgi:uncharacterized membrane protein
MKHLHFKRTLIAGCIAYVIGVAAFLTSFSFPVMSNVELQANLVLAIAIIPASIIGARFYYRKIKETHGLLLGIGMFLVVMALDAAITVPVFVIPAGGDHLSFFTDPGFWVIAVIYILSVTIYSKFKKRTV